MLVGVVLAGFLGMMGGVRPVPVRDVRMMSGFFVLAGFVMLCGLAMMFRCMLMVLSSFVVVVSAFVGHGRISLIWISVASQPTARLLMRRQRTMNFHGHGLKSLLREKKAVST